MRYILYYNYYVMHYALVRIIAQTDSYYYEL